MEQDKKTCPACHQFKSAQAFYKQAGRLESLCKTCKRERRLKRALGNSEPTDSRNDSVDLPVKATGALVTFTAEEINDLAQFFIELRKLKSGGDNP